MAWPLVGAAVWGVFAVPGDPSRSGGAPVPIAGWLRLALEAAFFGAAALALSRVTGPRVGLWFAALVVGHYAVSVARIRWLLRAA